MNKSENDLPDERVGTTGVAPDFLLLAQTVKNLEQNGFEISVILTDAQENENLINALNQANINKKKEE